MLTNIRKSIICSLSNNMLSAVKEELVTQNGKETLCIMIREKYSKRVNRLLTYIYIVWIINSNIRRW